MKTLINRVKYCTDGCNVLVKGFVLLLGLIVIYGVMAALFLCSRTIFESWF